MLRFAIQGANAAFGNCQRLHCGPLRHSSNIGLRQMLVLLWRKGDFVQEAASFVAPAVFAARRMAAKRIRGCSIACLLLLLIMTSAHAAQPLDDSSGASDLKRLSLEELVNLQVVSVSRHPEPLAHAASAIQVITAEQIRRSGATTLPEALRLADNLDVARKNAHDWAITARGFNTALANKLLVLIDGRTVYTPLFSGVFWDVQNYLLADIERIEVISGPGGTQWGANAVNGVINIITRSAKDTLGGYAEADAGSRLGALSAASYGARLSPDAFVRVYAEHIDHRDERLSSGPADDGWNLSQGGFRADMDVSKHDTLSVHGDAYSGNEGTVGGPSADVDGWNLVGRWSRHNDDGSGTGLQVYYDHTALRNPAPAFVIQGLTLAPAGFLRDELGTLDIDFQYRCAPGERNRLDWGMGFRRTHDVVENAPSLAFLPAKLDQSLYSAFVQDEIAIGQNAALTLGSKVEHNDYTGLEIEPSVRARWSVTEDTTLWAAISRAVRTPSRIDRDLSEPAPGAALIVLTGSDKFVAESVVADELGLRTRLSSRLSGSIAAFYNEYHDVRSTSATPATLVPLFFANNLRGRTYGIELSADYQATDTWRLHAGLDPLREHLHVRPGQFDLNAAHNETADPRQRAVLRSSLDLPHGIELDASLRWTTARVLNNGTALGSVPAYRDLDLRLGWHVRPNVEIALIGQNLLHDGHAEYGFPGPDRVLIQRSIYGKLVWRF
jgi:iron complex outermembrane receptor protein